MARRSSKHPLRAPAARLVPTLRAALKLVDAALGKLAQRRPRAPRRRG